MKKKTLLLSCLFLASGSLALAQEAPQLGKAPIDEIIKAMTLEEKAELLVGGGMKKNPELVKGVAGMTNAIPRLGIPATVVTDGPAGVRISPDGKGKGTTYCTAFPIGTLLSSTWNTALVRSVGKAMGEEVKEYGCDVLLGPALNIHRNPLCGRNFEYYSEDPLLVGEIGAAMVEGIQSDGVGVSIKHFVANNQETNRGAVDEHISPRALREINLRGFERIVKEADPWTIMTSYNKINGIYTSENRGLLQTILRDEWGFKGMVMTDWGGGRHAPAQVHAGNDLLMPGSARQAKDIVEAVQNGTLGIQNVNANVRRVLEYILKTPHFKAYAYTDKPDLKAHAQVTRHSAEEGMVLLKDDGHALPLKSGLKAAVFGNTSYNFISGGTGSGDVNEAYTISLVQGLKNDGFKPDTKLAASYAKYKADYDDAHKGEHHPWFEQRKPMPEMPLDEALLKKAAKADAVALITIGRNSGEGADRHVANDFDLSEAEKTLLHDVTDAFHAQHKPVVVILNIGGVIETASWSTIPDAILLAWQGGQEAGNSVADILKGLVNPSGKLPMTFPMSYDEVPSAANFPSNYVFTREPAKYVMGSLGKKDVDYTNYDEDIYVGYRYYDTFDKPVAYPFGYGLSYTSFSYKVAKDANDPYKVQVTVTNTGRRAGKEVVELYVSAPGENKPAQELRAFAKTELLKPGKSETLTLAFKEADLASYNEAAHAWIVDPGNYTVKVGASSRDIRGSYQFDIPQSRTVEVCHDVMLPMDPIRTMKK